MGLAPSWRARSGATGCSPPTRCSSSTTRTTSRRRRAPFRAISRPRSSRDAPMIPTLGHVAIVIGLALSAWAALAFVLGGRWRDDAVLASARRSVYLTFALAAVACVAMVISLLTHDFSVAYVARNNATTTPPFYSVISLWAALEGSILFWTLLLTGYASLAIWRHRDRQAALMPWVGATLAFIATFFFAVMTWPGNPFTRITPVAAEGNGPNALLQNHPFMALHPHCSTWATPA